MFSECVQSTANYKQFHPKTLACQTSTCSSSSKNSPSPLGAIFSNDGIVLFPTNAPYEIVSILSHQSCPQYSSSTSSFLSFSTQHSQHKLASTHKDSVLIWDTTGQSLQPLLSRLQYNTEGKSSQSSYIALDWSKRDETILTSYLNTVSIWDIRTNTRIRPSSTYVSNGNATIISLASSYIDHEFACIDSSGFVKIYDDRINHFHRTNAGYDVTSDDLFHFWAHRSGGFGIESFHMEGGNNTSNGYLTWGLETQEDLLQKDIKVWQQNSSDPKSNGEGFHPDYWNMGNVTGSDKDHSDGLTKEEHANKDSSIPYGCSSKLTVNNLSTVRICPVPFQDGFMTVSSSNDENENVPLWQIELWSFDNTDKKTTTIENVATYRYNEKEPSNSVYSEFANRNLIATELTLGLSSMFEHRKSFASASPSPDGCDVELIVCCLDDGGFVSTHAIQEAQSLVRKPNLSRNDNKNLDQANIFPGKRNKTMKIYQSNSDPDLASKDLRIRRGRGISDADLQYELNKTDSVTPDQISKVSDFLADNIGGGFQSRNDDDYVFIDSSNVEKNDDILASSPIGNIEVHSTLLAEVGRELDLIDEENLELNNVSSKKIDTSKARHVPCPRLCGATFSNRGGIIAFNNGEVKKMWLWYSNSGSSGATTEVPHLMKKVIDSDNLNITQHSKEDFSMIDVIGGSESMIKEKSNDFPRSMWGLFNMNEAAKFAQWGDENEENEENISDSSRSDEEAYMSDQECGVDSSSDSNFTIDNSDHKSLSEAIQESYFGKEEYGLPRYTSPLLNKSDGKAILLVPATESLVPKIFYTTIFDRIILNDQSPDLADIWIFGPTGKKRVHSTQENTFKFLKPVFSSNNEGHKELNNGSKDYIDRLDYAKEICCYNGKEALEIGQFRKAGVWNLLAQALENISCNIHRQFDGWRGFETSALGQNLLDEILKYYEIQGDVQILATIASVIGTGMTTNNFLSDDFLKIDIRRMDIYIYLYSNILYSWGRFEACAELKKHLHVSSRKASQQSAGLMFIPDDEGYSQFGSSSTKNVILGKKISSFQCSICRLPVKGLFSICVKCGHGGHFQHYMDWFSDKSVCPTGCGCSCSIVTINSSNGLSTG